MKPERLPALAEAYGLEGQIEDIGPVSPRYKHVHVLRVGGLHLVAKSGHGEYDDGLRRFYLGIQEHLHSVGYPIPRIYKTLTGEAVWDSNGDGILLTDFVGQHYDPSRQATQRTAAARALGWFHAVGPAAPDIGTHYWEDDDAGFEYAHALVRMSRGWLLDKNLSASSQKRAVEVLDDLTATFEEVKASPLLEGYWDLPHVPIHGEFSHHHCRYMGDEVAAVIDWGTVRLAPRLHDLSRTIDIGIG